MLAAVVLLGSRGTKEQKQIKLQLCNERCLMIGGYHGKEMKLDEKEKRIEKFSPSFFFSTSGSHLYDIEFFYL